jgi:hypothetical protein
MYDTGPKRLIDNFLKIDPDFVDGLGEPDRICQREGESPGYKILIKREGADNPWHTLLEIFSLYLTLDALYITPTPDRSSTRRLCLALTLGYGGLYSKEAEKSPGYIFHYTFGSSWPTRGSAIVPFFFFFFFFEKKGVISCRSITIAMVLSCRLTTTTSPFLTNSRAYIISMMCVVPGLQMWGVSSSISSPFPSASRMGPREIPRCSRRVASMLNFVSSQENSSPGPVEAWDPRGMEAVGRR